MRLLRILLFPIVPIYYLTTWWRNVFYDTNVFCSKSYDIPIICVGNLSVGGTGKTPMIEYLIRFLQSNYKTAILSRGYKRKTKGFVQASNSTTVADIGDEPYQFYSKFKGVSIAVDSDRQNGILQLLQSAEAPELILLDDAYQHRKISAGLNILLTAYNDLYSKDICLPTGNLREPRSGAQRAHIIVVTKCPHILDADEKDAIRKDLNIQDGQYLFFSRISYAEKIYSMNNVDSFEILKDVQFTLVTGIAYPQPLITYLTSQGLKFDHLNYSDHHEFSSSEIGAINSKEFVLTTEKDFMRLNGKCNSDNLYFLPIETKIDDPKNFEFLIQEYIKST